MGATPRGISGSRAAAVLGLSTWSTPYEVWRKIAHERHGPAWMKKHGHQIPAEFEMTSAAKFGLAAEGAIIIQSCMAPLTKGLIVQEREKAFGLDAYTTCHVDGIFYNALQDRVAVHEGKTTSAWAYRQYWGEPGTDEIPPEYQIQVQHNMMCARLPVAYVSVLVWPDTSEALERAGWEAVQTSDGDYLLVYRNYESDAVRLADSLAKLGYYHQYKVEADLALHEMMRGAYGQFWESIIKGNPPTSKTHEEARGRLKHIRGVARATPKIEELCLELSEIKAQRKAAEKSEKLLKKKVMEFMRQNAEPVQDVERVELVGQDGLRLHTFNGRVFR